MSFLIRELIRSLCWLESLLLRKKKKELAKLVFQAKYNIIVVFRELRKERKCFQSTSENTTAQKSRNQT